MEGLAAGAGPRWALEGGLCAGAQGHRGKTDGCGGGRTTESGTSLPVSSGERKQGY